MTKSVVTQDGDATHYRNISDAVYFMKSIPDDVTIISGDNEEIQSNKYILSIFCPSLGQLLSASSTPLLPECSTFSIKYLLSILENGFAVTKKLSNKSINEITKTAQLLSMTPTVSY